MLKFNRGLTATSVLLTILGVVAIGGVAYVAGKSSVPKSQTSDTPNYYPPTDERQNTQQVSDTSTVQQPVNTAPSQIISPVDDQSKQIGPIGCPPSITVLSPNGGEVYQVGQQINVKWRSCGISSSSLVRITIETSITGQSQSILLTPNGTVNDGSEILTIPTGFSTGQYYISVYTSVPNYFQDVSNRPFTINATQHVSTVISSPYITGTQWPPIIQKSSAAYSCSPSSTSSTGDYSYSTSGNPTVVQKVINSRTYCISSAVDGGAGHFGGDYTYTTANGSGTETATLQLQWPNCDGYGGPGDAQHDQCKADQTRVFNSLDAMVDSLM